MKKQTTHLLVLFLAIASACRIEFEPSETCIETGYVEGTCGGDRICTFFSSGVCMGWYYTEEFVCKKKVCTKWEQKANSK